MGKLPYLLLTTSWHQEIELLAQQIGRQTSAEPPLHILEAGCGQKWDLKPAGTPYVLTGVDIDEAALKIRMNVTKDLDAMIVGDLRSVQFSPNRFDVIVCSYVLEHIIDAERVLRNFRAWLKPGGIMIIQIPDPNSVKGFITRMTPHWFHVFYYRRIRRVENAGKPGHAPYPTHYDAVVSRRGIREFCVRNQLALTAEIGCGWRQHGHGRYADVIRWFERMVSVLSLRALSWRHDDLTFVIQKNPA